MHPMKRFLVRFEKIIMSLPVWQLGHVPMMRSCMLAFFMASFSASPMIFSCCFISVSTGLRRSMVSVSTFSLFSRLFCMRSIFSSSSRVSLTEITEEACLRRTSVTSKPRSVTCIRSSVMYFRL